MRVASDELDRALKREVALFRDALRSGEAGRSGQVGNVMQEHFRFVKSFRGNLTETLSMLVSFSICDMEVEIC